MALSFLPRLRCLRWLRLDFCEVSDLGAEQVAGCAGLEIVMLHHSSALTDRALVALSRLPALKHLSLYDTATTPEGRNALRAARPDVTVEPQDQDRAARR